MTRLIDADALPWQVLWAWRAGEEVCAVTADDIDNVPTVCCKECEHWARWRNVSDYGECAEGCTAHEHDPRLDFGCAYFLRRTT